MKKESSKRFTVERDTLAHQLRLKPTQENDTIPIILTYHNIDTTTLTVQGTIDEKNITAQLRKIDPVARLKLLRVKRRFWRIDPEVWE